MSDEPRDPDVDLKAAADHAFSTIVGKLEDGETIALDELCASRPDLAPALRARFDRWASDPKPQTPSDAPERGVSTSAAKNDAAAWRRFIDQVKSRGPAWTRYQFKGEIGRGGMGVVHRVFDADAKRNLALKVLREKKDRESSGSGGSQDDKTLGRFLEEAQVTSQLEHPNIVPVHEIGVDAKGAVYFTMKLVKGEDLRKVFEMVKRGEDGWTIPRAIGVLLKVCEAMSYAHAKSVIHRDLKPANVMVGRYGEVYVMDWGLARVLGAPDHRDLRIRPQDGDLSRVRTTRDESSESGSGESPVITMDGDVVGTPAYMPPEQASGELDKLGPWSDVYALGAMLYHLLAGIAPYHLPSAKASAWQILAALGQGPPKPILELRPDADPELVAICEKAMRRDVAKRYPTMLELSEDLRAFIEDKVVKAYESGLWAELKKWVHRNRTLAATIAAAVVVLGALAGWSYKSIHDERNVARANEQEARRQRQKSEWLLNVVHIDDLKKDWYALWPADPEHVPLLEKWLLRARAMLAVKPEYEAKLEEMRPAGTAQPHPRDGDLAKLQADLRFATESGLDGGGIPYWATPAQRAQIIERKRAEAAALEAAIRREQRVDFGENHEAREWFEQAQALLVRLADLEVDAPGQPTIPSMTRRLAFARTIRKRSIDDHAEDWKKAITEVSASPRYAGLELRPQLGLVPLGADPESGLQEFAHLQSGDVPARDPSTRRLAVAEGGAIVFVLLPGDDRFYMGSQRDDPQDVNFDPDTEAPEEPHHPVPLDPFFMAKHEVTQGQWLRLAGENPSRYRSDQPFPSGERIDLRHPVESVSWTQCTALVGKLGMGVVLPTEAQWEYACRGGTITPWWTGSEKAELSTAANLADRFLKTHGGADSWQYDDELDDGFAIHAPVGSLRPNALGLHDVIGNVREWCRDTYRLYREPVKPGDGERIASFEGDRIYRGGCWDGVARHSRCAHRDYAPPLFAADFIGVRFARTLDR